MGRVIHFVCATALIVALAAVRAQTAGPRLREIGDPYTGARWLLAANAAHPEGPRVLRLLAAEEGGALAAIREGPRAVIQAGEKIVVFQSTAKVEFTLEATALGAAPAGGELVARLKIGGRRVRARAVAPGRAEYLGDAGELR
jgi:hypothetical protein